MKNTKPKDGKEKFYGKIVSLTALFAVILLLASAGIAESQDQSRAPTSLMVDYNLTHIDKELKPGDTGTLLIVIRNTGGFEARDVKAWIPDTANIKGGDSWNIGDIAPGQSRIIETTIRINKNVYIGTHTTQLYLDYKSYWMDSNGRVDSKDQKTNWPIIIPVKGDINFVVQHVSKCVAGEDSNLEIEIGNIGRDKADDIIFTLSTGNEIIPVQSKINIDSIKPGEIAKLNFKVHVRESASGTLPIAIAISYDDGTGKKKNESLITSMSVSGTKNPKIIVDNIKISPDDAEPGKNVKVAITIKNAGEQNAKKITTKLNLSYPFTPIESGMSTYLEELKSGEEKTLNFTIVSGTNTKAGTYSIPLIIEYSNPQNIKQETLNDIFGIKLNGKAKLNLADIKTDPIKVITGNEATLMIRIENSGTGDAESVKASIDLPFQGVKEVFLGKIKVDDDALSVFILQPDNEGNFNYNLTIRYEDDLGAHNAHENLNIVVYPKNNDGTGIIAGVVITGIIFGIYWFFVRKKKVK